VTMGLPPLSPRRGCFQHPAVGCASDRRSDPRQHLTRAGTESARCRSTRHPAIETRAICVKNKQK